MAKQIPFFDLKTPQDLFAKLERDRSRIEANLMDSDAAFDFFVTANHLMDWAYPGISNKAKRDDLIKANPLLEVCKMIADGGKHFELDNPKHVSVTDMTDSPGGGNYFAALGGMFKGRYWGSGEPIAHLIVHFDPEWVKARGVVHPSFTVKYLARWVVEFWRKELERLEQHPHR